MHYQTGTGTGSSASASTHPSFVSGDIIETDYYDTSMINGSGSRVRYTGSTITANSTHWPDSDGYFYDGGGKQFKLIGPFNVLMFGAKGDNTNDDAPAINAAITASDLENLPPGGSQVQIPTGSYLLGSTIVLDKPGTSLRGHGNDSVVLKATHTNGPVIRVKADKCLLESFAIQSAGNRAGDSAPPGSNYGILQEPDGTLTNGVVLCKYQEVSVFNQPNHGMVLCVGLLMTEITNCAVQSNEGHGIVIDDGTEVGREEAHRSRAGAITIKDTIISQNKGHGIKAGSIWSNGQNLSVYRLILKNIECTSNASSTSVRLTAHNLWLILQTSSIELCGISGSVQQGNTLGGIYLKGSSVVLRNNRFINVYPNAIQIAGDITSGIIIEDFFVAGTAALNLDPAIAIDSDVEEVAVHTQYNNNVVQAEVDSLVTPDRYVDLADRGYRRIPSGHNALGYTSGDSITLANDTAVILTNFNNSTNAVNGILALACTIYAGGSGLIQFRVLNSNTATIIAQSPANIIETHIGVLTGMTGTAGKVTVSTAPFNSNIYIENRTGNTRTFTATFLSVNGIDP